MNGAREIDYYYGLCEGKKQFAFKMMGMGKITPDELTHYNAMYDQELAQTIHLDNRTKIESKAKEE
jgi:hypothetical protein